MSSLKTSRLIFVDIIIITFALFYFHFFVNKGIILSDEGYYVHYAERIAHGEIAYKDFLLQYTPGYFYLLALLYKIFGVQILVGRFLSMFFCLLLLTAILLLLHVHKITSPAFHIITGLTMIALGYPLLHIPLVIWPLVLFAVLLDITYIYWYRSGKIIFLLSLGLLLALSFFFRQHLGIVYLIIINVLIFFSGRNTRATNLRALLIINSVWLLFTGIWIYFFFIYKNNFSGLFILYEYNKQFISTFPFTYPPLTFLKQPTGFFKLLPYYYPIVFGFFVLYRLIKRQIEWDKLSLAFFALSGFFTTIYPASDLLHVYPFLGLVVVSSVIINYKKKLFPVVISLSIIFILLGFYLTFFTKSYRYDAYFLNETSPLLLPKTRGIMIDETDNVSKQLIPLADYINKYTSENDYIFVYPFHPMLYFVLNRPNPSGIVQFILLEAPESIYPEEKVLTEIRQHNVKYIITVGTYKYNKKISKFIQQQRIVFHTGGYNVFEITKR